MADRDLGSIGWCGAFMEYAESEGEVSVVTGLCGKCGEASNLIVPRKEVKARFREQLVDALPKVTTLSPSLKHFWFFAKCSKCHQEIVPMRS